MSSLSFLLNSTVTFCFIYQLRTNKWFQNESGNIFRNVTWEMYVVFTWGIFFIIDFMNRSPPVTFLWFMWTLLFAVQLAWFSEVISCCGAWNTSPYAILLRLLSILACWAENKRTFLFHIIFSCSTYQLTFLQID